MTDEFKSRLNPKRKLLLDQVMNQIEPEIEKTSKTAAVWKAIEKGIEWFELRDEKLSEIEEQREQLEDVEDKWTV